MNKRLIAERFSKAIHTYPQESGVQQQIAERMIDLLKRYLPHPSPKQVVEFGCGTAHYSRLLYQTFQPEKLILNDLCSDMQSCCIDLIDKGATFISGDAEKLHFPEDTDLLTSCSTLQWFEDPENFFRHSIHYLKQNGYFAFTTFGEENMKEIHSITDKGLPYRPLQNLEASLTPFYTIVHSEETICSRSFKSPLHVLRHLKETGVTGTGLQRWTRRELNHFCEEYIARFGNHASVSLTYHPIYIIAKKKKS